MIVELLKEPPATTPPPGAERRRSRRLQVLLPATLQPVDDKNPALAMEMEVRNISLHGAALRCAAPLPEGEAFHLDIGPGPLKLHARIRIVASRQRRNGMWDIGVEFF
jgi:hypothetical protein